jgi:hypothetical protein
MLLPSGAIITVFWGLSLVRVKFIFHGRWRCVGMTRKSVETFYKAPASPRMIRLYHEVALLWKLDVAVFVPKQP